MPGERSGSKMKNDVICILLDLPSSILSFKLAGETPVLPGKRP